jgi:hypothetical protein
MDYRAEKAWKSVAWRASGAAPAVSALVAMKFTSGCFPGFLDLLEKFVPVADIGLALLLLNPGCAAA